MYTDLCIFHSFTYVHICTQMNLCSHEAKREEKGLCLFPASSSPQACVATQMPLGLVYPTLPCPPPQALTVLVKIMGVHSATVVRSILDQLSCSSVLEVS